MPGAKSRLAKKCQFCRDFANLHLRSHQLPISYRRSFNNAGIGQIFHSPRLTLERGGELNTLLPTMRWQVSALDGTSLSQGGYLRDRLSWRLCYLPYGTVRAALRGGSNLTQLIVDEAVMASKSCQKYEIPTRF